MSRTERRSPQCDTRARGVLEAGCAGAGHRSSGCCSCHSRSYAATSVSRSRARRLSSVRGWRFSIISRTCSSRSATSKSCWSQAWWNAIRTLSDSRRVYLPIRSGLRRSWRSWFVTRPSTAPGAGPSAPALACCRSKVRIAGSAPATGGSEKRADGICIAPNAGFGGGHRSISGARRTCCCGYASRARIPKTEARRYGGVWATSA